MGIRRKGSLKMNRKAVFLDRDGVLNKAIVKAGKPYPPASVRDVVIEDTVYLALEKLKKAGYLLFGVTNQPDVARGTTLKTTVDEINNFLLNQLPLEEIRVCFHDDKDGCLCRKPLPGLILELKQEYCINHIDSFMIGDRWKDIEAGQRAGCKTIWLDYQYQEQHPNPPPTFTTNALLNAAHWILSNTL